LSSTLPYQFIAIEGNIGTGKTTLCTLLQQHLGCSLVLEQFTDNPFLPFFYKHPERYAFPVELFFMTERHKQLQEHFAEPDIFQQATVADYFFVKTQLFARNNLSEAEFRLFNRLFSVLNAGFPKPDLLIFLHRPVEIIQAQIKKRGREIEKDLSREYLESIKTAYFEYLKYEKDLPILLIDLEDCDFVSDQECFHQIKSLLFDTYPNGITYLHLKNNTLINPYYL
jgi:deoxyguanosine kinase